MVYHFKQRYSIRQGRQLICLAQTGFTDNSKGGAAMVKPNYLPGLTWQMVYLPREGLVRANEVENYNCLQAECRKNSLATKRLILLGREITRIQTTLD